MSTCKRATLHNGEPLSVNAFARARSYVNCVTLAELTHHVELPSLLNSASL